MVGFRRWLGSHSALAFALVVAGCVASPVFAQGAPATAAPASAPASAEQDVARLLNAKYPKLQTVSVAKITVESTQLFEFVAKGQDTSVLGYTDREVGFVFIGGELVANSQGKLVNVTKERAKIMASNVMQNLPTDAAIKIVYGKGERVVKMFSDPDCPFCRELEKTISTNPEAVNATFYIFPFPLTGLHAEADARARYILCTASPSQAWHDWGLSASTTRESWTAFQTAHPAQVGCPMASAVDTSVMLGKALGLAQTPVMIFENGKTLSQTPPLAELLEILAANSTPKAAAPASGNP